MRKAFTIVELLIVIVIIGLLAALLIPALVKAVCAAKETKAANIIHRVEGAAKMYERDMNRFPPMNSNFDSGPCVNALAKPGPKRQPYIEFEKDELTGWPVSEKSNIINPVDATDTIKYRDNTRKGVGKNPPIHNKWGIDMWCRDCDGRETGVNNWGGGD